MGQGVSRGGAQALALEAFSRCSSRAQESWLPGARTHAQCSWRTGLVALPHGGSPQTRDGACVSCIGRRVLYHCAAREARRPALMLRWRRKRGQCCPGVTDKGLDELWHFLSLGLHICKVGLKSPHLTGLQREQNV